VRPVITAMDAGEASAPELPLAAGTSAESVDAADSPHAATAPQCERAGAATGASLGVHDVAMLRLLVDLRSHVARHQRAVPGCIVALAVQPQRQQQHPGNQEEEEGKDKQHSPIGAEDVSAPVLVVDELGAATGYCADAGPPPRVVCWGYVRSMLRETQQSKRYQPVTDLHAESDCVAAAARNGIRLAGATMYVSSIPCLPCFTTMVAAGVRRVVHPPPPNPEFYARDAAHCLALAERHGVEVIGWAELPPHRRTDGPPDVPDIERALGEMG